MKLPDLQKQIVSGNFDTGYIFVGEEVAVMDIYLKKMAVAFEYTRVESAKEAFYRTVNRGMNPRTRLFVVRDDPDFLKNDAGWPLVFKEAKRSDVVVLIYSKLDKRSKFYKYFKDDIVEFEKLSTQILTKYIQKELPGMPEKDCARLAEMCECNYSRILLECNKIKMYSRVHDFPKTPMDLNKAMSILIEQGVIFQPIGDITFQFTDAVLVRDIKTSGKLLQQVRKKGESEILLLSVLYNGFKHILMYQGIGLNSNHISEKTGLTGWQVMNAKQKAGHYTISELVHALKVIRKVEKGIKTGQIDADISLEYAVLNIL